MSIGAIQKYEPRLGGAIFRRCGKHDAALTAAGIGFRAAGALVDQTGRAG
jgi:hypothetical protein